MRSHRVDQLSALQTANASKETLHREFFNENQCCCEHWLSDSWIAASSSPDVVSRVILISNELQRHACSCIFLLCAIT